MTLCIAIGLAAAVTHTEPADGEFDDGFDEGFA